MTNRLFRAPLSLALLAVILLSACSNQTPAPTVVPVAPTEAAAAPTAAPTAAPVAPTEAAAPTAAPTAAPVAAMTGPEELWMPREVKAAYASGARSPDGNPGPNYWQNRSVHDIKLTISPPDRTVTGTQTFTYTNNSPKPLTALGLRTYMDVHRREAMREDPVASPDFFTDGVTLGAVRINGQPIVPQQLIPFEATSYLLVLAQPVAPGASITLDMEWSYELAPANGWKEGVIDDTAFFLAYFYPRVAHNSETESAGNLGFDLDAFTARAGREAVNDFADFTVSVNVPKNFVVWATGDLQNPDEVLQPTYAERLAASFTSDEVVTIATPEETQQGLVTAQSDTVTWRWKADNVSDFALGLSDRWVWDAGSVVVDPATGRRASVQAAYPSDATSFISMVQDAKDTLAFGSTEWPGVPYPYSKMTVFAGGADEEYPMMANDEATLSERLTGMGVTTRLVAAHEVLHSWFPFAMGIDERRYPFMDEGWTTTFEYLFNTNDLGAEDASKIFVAFRSSRLASTVPGADLPIIYPADTTRLGPVGSNAYARPAVGYLALKELMGEEAFRTSLHAFMERWEGKHPLPWDMFNTFNEVSGQDLNWFFDRWFFQPTYLDLAIEAVEPAAGGATVVVRNVGGAPMPFDVIATYADGSSETFRQSPAVWRDSPTAATITLASGKEPVSVTLEGGIFVDATPADNSWASAGAAPAATPAAVSPPSAELTKLQANAWQWVAYNGPTEIIGITTSPGTYGLTFNADGTLAVKADCNQAAGSYQAADGKLAITLGPVTAAACGENSRSERLLSLLPSAALYRFDGDNLLIELMADGGTLTFTPAR
jgi:heat shock protein HslJ